MTINEGQPVDPDREAALAADRIIAQAPLPYAHVKQYEDYTQRQVDLAAASRSLAAKAAGVIGLTTAEYHDLRRQLGRSPGPHDVRR